MNIKVSIICIIIIQSFAFSQEDDNRLQDLLMWFPEGELYSISHIDLPALYRDYTEERFNKLFSEYLDPTNAKLPPGLRNRFDSVTTCMYLSNMRVICRERLKTHDPNEMIERRNPHNSFHKVFYGDYEYHTLADRVTCATFSIVNLEHFITSAVSRNELEIINVPDFKGKMYCYNRKRDPEFRVTPSSGAAALYYYATPADELLVAESVEDLLRMIKTGQSGTNPMFYHESISYLQEVYPYLGQMWSLRPDIRTSASRMLVEEGVLDRETNDRLLGSLPCARASSFHWTIDDTEPLHIFKKIDIFDDEEQAKKQYHRYQAISKSFRVEIPQDAAVALTKEGIAPRPSRGDYYVDGRWVIRERIQTVEDIEVARERSRILRETNEDRKKAEAGATRH